MKTPVEKKGFIQINIVVADIEKAAEKWADLLGIDIAETIGVGDSENDRAMIEAAGLGVGVANVSDDMRPCCDLVLYTCADDGAFPELVRRVIEPACGDYSTR